ncbi:MAG: hypothetical protein V7644_24 [Actinomycetota bacterium]
MSGFTFPAPRRPDVSIVIPTYGRWEWTVRALGALLANTEPCYELIVVDNASPDGTADLLAAATKNVRLVRNPVNLGFGLACNQGAACARAEFVVFLNSDALVHAGWLEPLLDRAAAKGRVGAVGPRFLYVDGSIHEAGDLLFGDATTAAYGSADAGGADDVGRPRVVDYVSAACLLVRRRAFDEVGGFDPGYGKVYYEDVDLCLSLGSHGYVTSYEPRSVVTHVHGWSPPQEDLDLALLARNRERFGSRWAELLAARPLRRDGRSRLAARDAPASDRLLVANGSGRGGDFARELAALCPRAHVALVGSHPDGTDSLVAVGVEVAAGGPEGAAEWLAQRRFHYDAVLAPEPLAGALDEAVRSTQPQAARLTAADVTALTDELLDLGVAVAARRTERSR